MQAIKIPFDKISQFSKRDVAYHLNPSTFESFIEAIPSLESIHDKIKSRQNFPVARQVLHDHLVSQYQNLEVDSLVQANIKSLLKENTFTITTAHQPTLFTGPLYFIFKILSVIRLTEILKEKYSTYNFVPVFVSGGEDHDFEEINHTFLFGKRIEWENDETGSCGRMSISKLEPIILEVESILGGSPLAEEITQVLKNAFKTSKTYAEFNLALVNSLFGKYGLLQINMDAPKLKHLFKDILIKETTEQFSEPLVREEIEKIETHGYKGQAEPREINLFYLRKGERNRIVKSGSDYEVLNTDLKFTPEALLADINTNPGNYSPNVILRPLYQERILPNLVYVGGGGEIAYWLERKSQFNASNISFPILIRRNSAAIIDKKKWTQWNDLTFSKDHLSVPLDQLKSQFAKGQNEIPNSLVTIKQKIKELYASLEAEIGSIDKSLKKTVNGEFQKTEKGLQQIEHKLIRSFKQKEESSINRISKIHEFLFPNNGLQERKANFMEFYIKKGPDLFDELKEQLNPLETDFTLFVMN